MRMDASHGRRAAVLALLALAAFGASASELRALSENEMSGVYGQGLAVPAGFGLLSAQEQGGAYASAGDATAALGAMSGDSAKNLERQMRSSSSSWPPPACRPPSRPRRRWPSRPRRSPPSQ
jgi:hypothetical protein